MAAVIIFNMPFRDSYVIWSPLILFVLAFNNCWNHFKSSVWHYLVRWMGWYDNFLASKK